MNSCSKVQQLARLKQIWHTIKSDSQWDYPYRVKHIYYGLQVQSWENKLQIQFPNGSGLVTFHRKSSQEPLLKRHKMTNWKTFNDQTKLIHKCWEKYMQIFHSFGSANKKSGKTSWYLNKFFHLFFSQNSRKLLFQVLLRNVNTVKTANCTKLPNLPEKAESTLSKL